MDVLEFQRLLVALGHLAASLELPGGRIAEVFVVALGFAVLELVFHAEVAAARLVAVKGVSAEKLGELEKVRRAPRVLQLLVDLRAVAGDLPAFAQGLPDPLELRDR